VAKKEYRIFSKIPKRQSIYYITNNATTIDQWKKYFQWRSYDNSAQIWNKYLTMLQKKHTSKTIMIIMKNKIKILPTLIN
jgi:hypothetical protein